jgi:hypothetical protein
MLRTPILKPRVLTKGETVWNEDNTRGEVLQSFAKEATVFEKQVIARKPKDSVKPKETATRHQHGPEIQISCLGGK